MNKNFIMLIICVMCASGCAKGWSNEEKNKFINDCLETEGTPEVCDCVLNCLEKNYQNYQSVLESIPSIPISEQIKNCVSKCE
mgnify:CR=1 FL=1|jgi:hypothetical protein|tara:strand:+ start:289 stop:537 length:249 start_codon:yes stop_codon:yes gene_type:complete